MSYQRLSRARGRDPPDSVRHRFAFSLDAVSDGEQVADEDDRRERRASTQGFGYE
jgi:hypothetical protein